MNKQTDTPRPHLPLGAEALDDLDVDSASPDHLREALLRYLWKPTPEGLISKLPRYSGRRGTAKDQRERGTCKECGSYHELPAIHLDYCGHSDTTRLIAEVDPIWQWEPRAGWDEKTGEPVFIRDAKGYPTTLWINLTILGVTRPGVGTVETGKSDPEKELIGDAIRNAAMRFGIAADLWSKASHDLDDSGSNRDPSRPAAAAGPPDDPEWWQERGWSSRDDHDAKRKALIERIAKLPEAGKAAIREWWDQRGGTFREPQTHELYVDLEAEIEKVEHEVPEAAQAPAEGSTPEGAAEPPAGQETAIEPPAAGDEDERPCPLCLGGPSKTVDPGCRGCAGTGFRPVFRNTGNDGNPACELCGSVRAERVDIRGVHRCSDANGCRDRVEKATPVEKAG